MADFTNLNLEGANELFNKTATDAKSLKDSLVAQHGADASAMKASVESKVADLQSSLSSMIPELPAIPNVNMQGDFAGLADIDLKTPAGLEQYKSQVSSITEKFGPAMADKGLDIDGLATKIQEGGDVGDLIPNLQLADGGTLPFELPSNVKIPSIEAIKEKLETIPDFKIEIDGSVLKEKAQEALDAIEAEKLKQETESKWTLS
jgi:hypothetical protein